MGSIEKNSNFMAPQNGMAFKLNNTITKNIEDHVNSNFQSKIQFPASKKFNTILEREVTFFLN